MGATGAPVGTQPERTGGAQREQGDEGVVDVAQLTVAVGRHAVAAVAVVVARDRAERHAVARRESVTHASEHRVGEHLGPGARGTRGAGRRPCGRT